MQDRGTDAFRRLSLTFTERAMATVIDSIPGKEPSKYLKYFDGQIWQLKLGRDLPDDMNKAQNVLRVTAKRHDIEATITQRQAEGCIYVQAKVAKKRKSR